MRGVMPFEFSVASEKLWPASRWKPESTASSWPYSVRIRGTNEFDSFEFEVTPEPRKSNSP